MADSITATSATTIDGKAIKLRASCDACNESKVRCNQSKPGCARCERLRVPCVYGLSRRTHKSAPRVGASSPLALPALPPLPPPPQPPPPPPPSSQPQPLSSQSQPLSSQATHHPPITGDGSSTLFSLIPASLQLEDPDVSACLPLSSSQAVVDMYDMDMPFDWTLNPTAAAFASHLSFLDSPGIATPSNSIPMSSLGSEPMDNWPSTSSPLCNCINDFLKQLLSSPSSLDTLGTSWETYVSHLRQVINVAERCVQCNCISRDEFSLVTISVLVGRIIQGFETVFSRVWPSTSPPSGDSSTQSINSSSTFTSISWGSLQIEPDEEHEIKQHLLLLQFRKFQKVLENLRNSLHQSRNRQSTSNSAHLMACQYIHMWLAQRADLVKDRYFGSQ